MTSEDLEKALGVAVREVVTPGDEGTLAKFVENYAGDQRKILASGSASKLAWGAVPDVSELTVVRLTGLNKITDHDPANLTVSVEAGVPYRILQQTLAEHGQWLPLDSPWSEEATLGGIVAAAASGPRRYGYGAPRDLVLGVRLVLPDGSAVHFGGKTVKNVAGYDVTKLLVGSFGTLAFLTEITFRLRPLPSEERSLLVSFDDPDSLDRAVETVLRSPDPVVAVEAVGPRGADLLDSRGVSVAAGAYLLAFRLEGTGPVLEVAAQRLASGLGGSSTGAGPTVLEASDSATFWSNYERAFYRDWQRAGAVLKVRGPVRNAVKLLAVLESVGAGHVWVGAGTGVGFLRVESDDVDLVSLLGEVRSALRPLQARADLLVAQPSAARLVCDAGIPLWEIPNSLLAKMREVKRIFDPADLLAPGRFVGGI